MPDSLKNGPADQDLATQVVRPPSNLKVAIWLWIAVLVCLIPFFAWAVFVGPAPPGEGAPGDGIPLAFSVATSGIMSLFAIIWSLRSAIDFVRARRRKRTVDPTTQGNGSAQAET